MITFISVNDWANVGYHYAKALRSVGQNAEAYTINKHVFDYKEQATLITDKDYLYSILDETDHLVHMHSTLIKPTNKKFNFKTETVFHGGSYYRNNFSKINKIFYDHNKHYRSIIQTRDLWNLGAQNKVWVLPPIDVNDYAPQYTTKTPFLVAHYPSSSLKGTDRYIRPLFQHLENIYPEFTHDIGDYNNRVAHEYNLERMADNCQVYVEALHEPETRCGCWGITAMEACALGKFVITNDSYEHEFKEEYGNYPRGFRAIKNYLQLSNLLQNILYEDPNLLIEYAKESREWLKNTLSYEKVGKKLLDNLFS